MDQGGSTRRWGGLFASRAVVALVMLSTLAFRQAAQPTRPAPTLCSSTLSSVSLHKNVKVAERADLHTGSTRPSWGKRGSSNRAGR